MTAENSRLRESLETLRESVAQSAEGTENSAVREVMGKIILLFLKRTLFVLRESLYKRVCFRREGKKRQKT